MASTGGAQPFVSPTSRAAPKPKAPARRPAAAKKPARRPTPAARKLGQRRARARARPTARPTPSPLYDPAAPLTGGPLKSAARALTDLEIRPQVSLLQRTVQNNNDQARAVQQRVAGYYDQFGDLARAGLTAQQGVSDRLNQTLAAIGAGTQTTLAGIGQQAADQTRPMADVGLDGGALAKLAAETAASRQLAAQNAQTAQTFGAQQGAGMEGLTATIPGVAALRGQDSMRQLSNAHALANQEPLAKIAELQGSRGALMTKNLGALRESERNYSLARDTLGLNAQKAAADAQSDAADRRQRAWIARLNAMVQMRSQDIRRMIADRTFLLNMQRFGWEQAVDDYQRKHGLGPYEPGGSGSKGRRRTLTPGQINAAWGAVDSARTTIQQLRDQGFGTRAIRQALTNGYYIVSATGRRFDVPKIPGGGYGTYVNTAMDIAVKGYISPANKRALHRAGLKIGRRYPVWRGLPGDVAGPERPI